MTDSTQLVPLRGIEVGAPPPETDALVRLRARFASMRCAPIVAQLNLCRAVAAFIACDGPRWLGRVQRDYIRADLGVPASTFKTWLRVGRGLLLHPPLGTEARSGSLSFGVVDVLCRSAQSVEELELMLPLVRGRTIRDARIIVRQFSEAASVRGPTGAREPDRARPHSNSPSGAWDAQADPDFQRTAFVVPVPVAIYIEETMQLARAMSGHDGPEDQLFAAVIAESSTELDLTVPLDEARRRFKLKPPSPARSRRSSAASASLPKPTFVWRGQSGQRRAANILHRYIKRLLDRIEFMEFDLEDAVLALLESQRHHRSGYPRFEDFAHDVLDIPASTAWERVQSARERRAGHPIAAARRQGRISAVQARMLHRLERRIHVPRSDLDPWIEMAEATTTLRLREAISWARRRRDTDYANWSNAGCPPPGDGQLRMFTRPLEDIVRDPAPSDFDPEITPQTTVRFTLERDTLELTIQLIASIQHQQGGPEWQALLRIFHFARQSWAQHHEDLTDYQGRIRRRDRWRCQVPECSRCDITQGHHVRHRSAGGGDEDENVVTLCCVPPSPCRTRGQDHPRGGASDPRLRLIAVARGHWPKRSILSGSVVGEELR